MKISDAKNIPFSNEAIIGEVAEQIDNGDIIVLGKQYSSRDYIIETRQDGDAQIFIVRKRRV